MDIIAIQTFWSGLVLYILYETSAVYSYISSWPMKLFNRLTKVRQYKKTNDGMSYSDWMSIHHENSFLIKLLSCRYCFGVWTSFGICMTTNSPENIPIVYFGGQLICSIFALIERKIKNA
jgi:hypothetical protein